MHLQPYTRLELTAQVWRTRGRVFVPERAFAQHAAVRRVRTFTQSLC